MITSVESSFAAMDVAGVSRRSSSPQQSEATPKTSSWISTVIGAKTGVDAVRFLSLRLKSWLHRGSVNADVFDVCLSFSSFYLDLRSLLSPS